MWKLSRCSTQPNCSHRILTTDVNKIFDCPQKQFYRPKASFTIIPGTCGIPSYSVGGWRAIETQKKRNYTSIEFKICTLCVSERALACVQTSLLWWQTFLLLICLWSWSLEAPLRHTTQIWHLPCQLFAEVVMKLICSWRNRHWAR
jgi:hypothetical protein